MKDGNNIHEIIAILYALTQMSNVTMICEVKPRFTSDILEAHISIFILNHEVEKDIAVSLEKLKMTDLQK